MENNLYNGRVNILSGNSRRYPEYEKCDNVPSSSGLDIVSKTIGHTPVSSLFFSKMNIDALQKGICNKVFNLSDGKYNIGNQSESELKIIMRSFYFESLTKGFPNVMREIKKLNDQALNIPVNHSYESVLEQVRNLNKSVLDWAVPQILTNIQQFDKYKEDVSKLPQPMDRPKFSSMSGTKSLELQTFF